MASPDVALIAGGILVAVVLLAVVFRLLRRPAPGVEEKAPELPPDLRTPPAGKVAKKQLDEAAEALRKAREDRQRAEERAKKDAEGRAQREEAARRSAEQQAKARSEAEARVQELLRRAEEAETAEEREKARKEARELEQEIKRHLEEEEEARKKAEYEARKAEEVQQRAERQKEREQEKLRELEEARALAEAQAREAAEAEAARQRKIEAESGRTLSDGLARTRGGFVARLAQLVGASSSLDDKFIGELEEILFTADIGVRTAEGLLEHVREKLKRKELSSPDKVRSAIREEVERILSLDGQYPAGGMPPATDSPQVVMVVGVNGSGKTTSIGKLAFQQRVEGKKVLLGAGDTFRAAAAEQLEVWAKRAEVDFVQGPANGDPAAVCFDAVKRAVDEKADLCLLDTAGRLHTKAPLMDELKKVRRVVERAMPGAPHEVWLVVDGTTGQNALMQARQFHEALGLTGLILTKLDGTAKGGVVIGVCDELKVPVRYVGIGEKIGDLKPFDAKEFVDALFSV